MLNVNFLLGRFVFVTGFRFERDEGVVRVWRYESSRVQMLRVKRIKVKVQRLKVKG
jgi:hypothetical protein